MSAPTVTVTDREAFAQWAVEHHPKRCSITIVVPAERVASNEFQRILSRLSLVASRFDIEVDPMLLGELVADGKCGWLPYGYRVLEAPGCELVPGVTAGLGQ